MNFLFWNVNRKNFDKVIVDLVLENDIDVLILAEYEENILELLGEFKHRDKLMHYYPNIPKRDRLKIFTNFPESKIQRLVDEHHYLALKIPHSDLGYITLFAIHFFSKLHRNEPDFLMKSYRFSNAVTEIEKRVDSKNTVLCGDFNMNPFEQGMTISGGMHAFPTKVEARKIKRTIDYEEYEMFYNPMWKFIGEETSLGTYYHSNPDSDGLYWNVFDQVLVRPNLINRLEGLSIIRQTANDILATDEKILISDHLPIKFSIN